MNVTYLLAAIMLLIAGFYMARRAFGRGERREAIDVDIVLDEKYPNRARRVEPEPEPEPVFPSEPVLEPEPEFDWETALALPPTADPIPGARHAAMAGATPRATGRLQSLDPEPRRGPGIFVAVGIGDEMPGWLPLPFEPSELTGGLRPDPARGVDDLYASLADPIDGRAARLAAPIEQLRRRRDRVARDAEVAFAEVHKLRIDAMRRTAQAEHNAELATAARARVGRRDESRGRRGVDQPNVQDTFIEVHQFRLEAVRRAQDAERGAEAISRARSRANRLLDEKRRLDAEIERRERGVPPL